MSQLVRQLQTTLSELRTRSALRLLGALFITTGFTGLLAEQSFEKLLSSLLGASTPAAAVVLAVYFLGLTLGSILYIKFSKRVRNPLRLFATLEAVVAIWCLLLLMGSQLLVILFTPLLQFASGKFWLLQTLRGAVALFWMLPPTLAMGATFPAIADSLALLKIPQPRRAMSQFYSLNLAGAILGTLVGPYLIFPAFGLTGALGLTFITDGVVAGLAYLLSQRRQSVTAVAKILGPNGSQDPSRSTLHLQLLSVSFLSGFIFFSLEIVWTHLIAAVMGNSVYAFSAMLALVLMGLGLGGILATLLFKERKPASTLVVAVLILGGSLSLAWTHSLWPELPLEFIKWGSNLTTFQDGELLRWIQAARLLLPPAILFGMVYPALFRLRIFTGDSMGQLAAMVGAANSIGCVLGALLTGFVVIPSLGSQGTLVGLGFLSVLAALILALGYSGTSTRWPLVSAALVISGFWAARPDWNRLSLTFGGHVYFAPGHVKPGSKLVFFHEDTLGGITTVIETKDPNAPGLPPVRTLLTNGKFQANDSGEVQAQTGFALVPIIHTRNFGRALVIGLGSGHTAEVVHRMGFSDVDIAEIAPGIIEAAKVHFSHINGRVLEESNTHLVLEDGRNHLLLTPHSYDLITMEITSLWFAGATSLYSKEFYTLAKKHLSQTGILQQWVQIHHLGSEEVGSVVKTIREVFPYVEFWIVGGQGIILGSETPLMLQRSSLEKLLAQRFWPDLSAAAALTQLRSVLASRLLSSTDVDRLLAIDTYPINTDANRHLEYASPRYNLSRAPHQLLLIRQFGRFASFPAFPPEAFASPALTGLDKGLPEEAHRNFRIDQ